MDSKTNKKKSENERAARAARRKSSAEKAADARNNSKSKSTEVDQEKEEEATKKANEAKEFLEKAARVKSIKQEEIKIKQEENAQRLSTLGYIPDSLEEETDRFDNPGTTSHSDVAAMDTYGEDLSSPKLAAFCQTQYDHLRDYPTARQLEEQQEAITKERATLKKIPPSSPPVEHAPYSPRNETGRSKTTSNHVPPSTKPKPTTKTAPPQEVTGRNVGPSQRTGEGARAQNSGERSDSKQASSNANNFFPASGRTLVEGPIAAGIGSKSTQHSPARSRQSPVYTPMKVDTSTVDELKTDSTQVFPEDQIDLAYNKDEYNSDYDDAKDQNYSPEEDCDSESVDLSVHEDTNTRKRTNQRYKQTKKRTRTTGIVRKLGTAKLPSRSIRSSTGHSRMAPNNQPKKATRSRTSTANPTPPATPTRNVQKPRDPYSPSGKMPTERTHKNRLMETSLKKAFENINNLDDKSHNASPVFEEFATKEKYPKTSTIFEKLFIAALQNKGMAYVKGFLSKQDAFNLFGLGTALFNSDRENEKLVNLEGKGVHMMFLEKNALDNRKHILHDYDLPKISLENAKKRMMVISHIIYSDPEQGHMKQPVSLQSDNNYEEWVKTIHANQTSVSAIPEGDPLPTDPVLANIIRFEKKKDGDALNFGSMLKCVHPSGRFFCAQIALTKETETPMVISRNKLQGAPIKKSNTDVPDLYSRYETFFPSICQNDAFPKGSDGHKPTFPYDKTMEPGDAFFFMSDVLHLVPQNESKFDRFVLYMAHPKQPVSLSPLDSFLLPDLMGRALTFHRSTIIEAPHYDFNYWIGKGFIYTMVMFIRLSNDTNLKNISAVETPGKLKELVDVLNYLLGRVNCPDPDVASSDHGCGATVVEVAETRIRYMVELLQNETRLVFPNLDEDSVPVMREHIIAYREEDLREEEVSEVEGSETSD